MVISNFNTKMDYKCIKSAMSMGFSSYEAVILNHGDLKITMYVVIEVVVICIIKSTSCIQIYTYQTQNAKNYPGWV